MLAARFNVRRSSGRHGAASLGAVLAGLGASFAVIHCVLCALSTTRFARFGTQGTYRLHVLTTASDGRGGQVANVCTFQIQRDAMNHGLGLVFLEGANRTLKAGRRTFGACAKAFDFFFAKHLEYLRCYRTFGRPLTPRSGWPYVRQPTQALLLSQHTPFHMLSSFIRSY